MAWAAAASTTVVNGAASTTVVNGATAQPFGSAAALKGGPPVRFFSPLSFDPADLHRPFWIASGLLLREEISMLAVRVAVQKLRLLSCWLWRVLPGGRNSAHFGSRGSDPAD
jgi:hypothetical protein